MTIIDTSVGRGFDDVAVEFDGLRRRIVELRGEGARLLADRDASGHEVLTWLVKHGATDHEARTLIVQIIHERRVVRGKTTR